MKRWIPFLTGELRPSNKALPAPLLSWTKYPQSDTELTPVEIGGGVSPPIPISTVNPEYTPEARTAHRSGSVALVLVVGDDGTVKYVAIVKPLGLGLDDAAAQAVLAWKFRPALRSGVPVAAKLYVDDMRFSIF